MLQPTNRLMLVDAMQPPSGFRFESAMAVTFTLDLRALLAIPAALAFAAGGSTSPQASGDADTASTTRSSQEPIELIHALRSHASKLTVFSQAGEIGLPPSRRVFAFLERAVLPVTAPRGGIVHPKVWVIRYESTSDKSTSDGTGGGTRARTLRVLIASRNLTFDASWDTVVRLDETVDSSGVGLAPVGELFEGLLDIADSRVAESHRQRVSSLATALRQASFQLPAGVDGLRTHIVGFGETPSPLLPSEAERSLIISPFVSDRFFTTVYPTAVDELVSRPESLDGLAPETLTRVTKVHSFDDGSAPELDAEDDRRSRLDPGRPLAGLHAKIFAFETGPRAQLFLGSANAVSAAFSSNVEILVELTGPTSVLGIDRLCAGLDDERGLRDYFYDYRPSDNNDTDEETSLDRYRHAIALLPIQGHVESSNPERAATRADEPAAPTAPRLNAEDHGTVRAAPAAGSPTLPAPAETVRAASPTQAATAADLPAASSAQVGSVEPGDDGSWAVTYRTDEPLPQPQGVKISCWPLTSAGHRREVVAGRPLHERFETSLDNLSGFLAFELEAEDGTVSSFVVPVQLSGVPEQRDRLLLRMLIGNAERFFRYLMALLDEETEEVSLVDAVTRLSDETTEAGPGQPSLPVLEKLLRTMRREPHKLAGLNPLVSDLDADGALPEGFAELWKMIHDVATAEAATR